MSEVHFQMNARFPDAALSARFFRAIYARTTPGDLTSATETLTAIGVDPDEILDPDLTWEIEDCGVDDRECFHLKAVTAAGDDQEVIGALTRAAARAGASSVLTVLYDTSTGVYQALGADESGVVELYTTENYDAVGDDYFHGVRSLLAKAHQLTKRLTEDGLLGPEKA